MRRVYLAFALVLMVAAGVLPACAESSDAVRVDANAKRTSLSEIWERVVEKTGIQDATANLAELSFWISEDGKVEVLHYIFQANDSHGFSRTYNVNSQYGGDVTCHMDDPSTAIGEIHPLRVFEELDKVSLASIHPGLESHVNMSIMSGAVAYQDTEDCDLYSLNTGELVPLQFVLFRTNTPWAVISFTSLQESSSASVQHWFLTSDLEKAEHVEYA